MHTEIRFQPFQPNVVYRRPQHWSTTEAEHGDEHQDRQQIEIVFQSRHSSLPLYASETTTLQFPLTDGNTSAKAGPLPSGGVFM
jgi:hypothetical protein